MLSLMGKVRNIFAIDVGRYVKKAPERKAAFGSACAIWTEAARQLLCA
jgi:putative transposase